MKYKFKIGDRVRFLALSKKFDAPNEATGAVKERFHYSRKENYYRIFPDEAYKHLFETRDGLIGRSESEELWKQNEKM